MPLALSVGRFLVIAGLLLGLMACGRRGALEPPPDPAAIAAEQKKSAQRQSIKGGSSRSVPMGGASAPATEGQGNAPGQAQVADEGDADDPVAQGPAASPTVALGPTRRRAREPFVKPKEPFILDPLL